jgi:hypothetical protein
MESDSACLCMDIKNEKFSDRIICFFVLVIDKKQEAEACEPKP